MTRTATVIRRRASALGVLCLVMVAACAASPAATTAPTVGATPLPVSGALEPGRYVVPKPFPVPFELEVGAEWGVYAVDACCLLLEHREHVPPGLVLFNAWTVDAVYTDPCKHVAGPPVGPSVDDLVRAFEAAKALGPTPATDVVIGGVAARHLTLELDEDIEFGACDGGQFQMWAWKGEPIRYVPGGYHAVRDELWILEVNGSRIVLDGSLVERTAADDALLDAIVRSITFPAA